MTERNPEIDVRNNGDGRKIRLLSLADLDGRTRAKQRASELRDRVVSERGGADRLDALKLVHSETWAVLSALVEDMLARVLMGEAIEPASIATLVNAHRREGEAIGAPEPRDVTPSLAEYIATHYPDKPDDTTQED